MNEGSRLEAIQTEKESSISGTNHRPHVADNKDSTGRSKGK